METTGNYPIPNDPGNLKPGGCGTRPMDKPIIVNESGSNFPSSGESHLDNPPAEMGVHSPSSVGVPQSKPVWNGSSDGPDPQPARPTGHPALRGQ